VIDRHFILAWELTGLCKFSLEQKQGDRILWLMETLTALDLCDFIDGVYSGARPLLGVKETSHCI
jgi:hypothetical protein